MILELGVLGYMAVNYFSKENAKSDNQEWTRYDALFEKYALKYQVPSSWLKAIALNESNLGKAPSVALGLRDPENVEGSKSSDGLSWGLMQVTLTTARSLDPSATQVKLNNPEYSIDLAARIVRDNMKSVMSFLPLNDPRYIEFVIKSYNEGPGHAKNEYLGKPSNPKWQAHVQEYWSQFKINLDLVKKGAQ